MSSEQFRFYHPIFVRYGDLDTQGHVNNAKYLTYLEDGRVAYYLHLGIWDDRSSRGIGMLLVDVHLTYRDRIYLGQPVRVGVRTVKIGNKSITMEQDIEVADSSRVLAEATLVLVTYDLRSEKTIRVPDAWREILGRFEGWDEFMNKGLLEE